MEKSNEIRIMNEFDDVNFIPTKDFIEIIDYTQYPNLKLLNGYIPDGRLKNYTQIDNIQDYIDIKCFHY